MGSFSFKSVGKTQEDRVTEALVVSPTPLGIKTPLQPGGGAGIFAVHYELADVVHDNLKNLILTNWGDRLVAYNLGANLRPLMSELVSLDDFDAQAIERIRGAVSKWMPYVSLETFQSDADKTQNKNTAIIRLTIVYSVPALNVSNKMLQVVLYAI